MRPAPAPDDGHASQMTPPSPRNTRKAEARRSWSADLDERTQRVSDLLHEAGEVHHIVYRITDGADDDWASFYANWLIDHSELSETLGRAPTCSHLVDELVESERAFAETAPAARWQAFHADRIVGRFG